MRDNHKELLELLNAFEEDGCFFGLIELRNDNQKQCFQFGVSHEGYVCLRSVLQLRPFEDLPGLIYRHFFVPTYGRIGDTHATMTIRIEQEKQGKQFTFKAPRALVANLRWFFELKNWHEAKYLIPNT
jgi:hypothetical protein